MIRLSNGFEFTFCCASGALGFDGDGWWWEQPLRWLRILRPEEFTIIAKTVTFEPRVGNLNMWHPWTCVQLIPGGAVNSVGLTNMGYEAWIDKCYPTAIKRGYNIISSIQPTNEEEGAEMAKCMNWLNLRAIEINLSCPNTKDSYDPVAVVRSVQQATSLPIIAKLGFDNIELVPLLSKYVEAFDLINTVSWDKIYQKRKSPLAKYGLVGGVSGRPIKNIARTCLTAAKKMTDKPIISGGGIDGLHEVMAREYLGAAAFSLGTVFLRSPWLPNRIVNQYHAHHNTLKQQLLSRSSDEPQASKLSDDPGHPGHGNRGNTEPDRSGSADRPGHEEYRADELRAAAPRFGQVDGRTNPPQGT